MEKGANRVYKSKPQFCRCYEVHLMMQGHRPPALHNSC